MKPQPKYKFYATLLDAFTNYLNSQAIWEKYWGFSENPPHTPEEFEKQQEQELIDRINRKPFQSYEADKGSVFNELVDACIQHRQPYDMSVERTTDKKTGEPLYEVTYKEQVFYIPISIVSRFYNLYKDDSTSQELVKGIVHTMYGDVEVYGYVDEMLPFSIHDIKTTKSYSFPKFKDNWQHIVYPYCIEDADTMEFVYDVTDWKEIYKETYIFDRERDTPKLVDICEQFIQFLEEHKEMITDKKVFAYREVFAQNEEVHG